MFASTAKTATLSTTKRLFAKRPSFTSIHIGLSVRRWKTDDSLDKAIPAEVETIKIPDENPLIPKEHVFQELRSKQHGDPVYTIQEAAEDRPMESKNIFYKYQRIAQQHTDVEYSLRSTENEYSLVYHFPEMTDACIIGSGLVGSAAAYYMKKAVSRAADVLVLDKEPYGLHNNTALCNGLISSQSKCQDISRVACLSKELIRLLRHEVLVTEEDYASINYRPVTHLILWPKSEVEEVVEAASMQIEDGCYTDVKEPRELEKSFPWLRACDTDIALGTHGNQDEALVDPLALRNLYRTLAQGYGASFIKAEVIDFNMMHSMRLDEVHPGHATAVICRLPHTGELRHLSFAKVLLSLGHNTPFLEARADMESYMRSQIEDLHFIQPKLKIYFTFYSMNAPVINFPVITDTDGSLLIQQDFCGSFKYYLNYEESESFLDMDYENLMNINEIPYPNLMHKSKLYEDYFNDTVKPRLVNRIPVMEDATFMFAQSGFENVNQHDGSPVLGQHPFFDKILIGAGFGSRMMMYAPLLGATTSELMLDDEENLYDLNNFYWNRVIKGRKLKEFPSLLR